MSRTKLSPEIDDIFAGIGDVALAVMHVCRVQTRETVNKKTTGIVVDICQNTNATRLRDSLADSLLDRYETLKCIREHHNRRHDFGTRLHASKKLTIENRFGR